MPETAVSPVSPIVTVTVWSLVCDAGRAPGPSTALAIAPALAPAMPSAIAPMDAALMDAALIMAPLPPGVSEAQRLSPVQSDAVTVTVVSLLFSGIFEGFITRMMIGWSSSSIVTSASLPTSRRVAVPDTVIVSSPSFSVSSVGVRVNVARPFFCPAGMVRVKSLTAS